MIRSHIKILTLLFCGAFFVLSSNLWAEKTREEGAPLSLIEIQKEKAVLARELLFHRKYDEAEELFQTFIKEWSDQLIGYFGMMILYQVQNLENFDERFDGPYSQWHDKGRKRAIKILYNPKSDPWELFLAGGTLAISGFYKAHAGKMIRGLRDGIMGIHAMEKALDRDPDWIDPYLGLGLYDYWRTVFTQKFRFIPFFPDRREEGMEKLKRTIKEGNFSKDLARGALAWSYLYEKKYKEAQPLCEELLEKYPENLIIQLLHGHVLSKSGQFSKALEKYRHVLATDPEITKVYFYVARNYFEEVEARKKEAEKGKKRRAKGPIPEEQKSFKGGYGEAILWLEKFLETEPNKTWKGLAYNLWGEVLYQQGRYEEAQDKFQIALKYDYSLYNPKRRLRKFP